MTFLPVCINITDKKILVVGGGKTAVHKLNTLIKYTRNITVLAPDIIDDIIDLDVECIKKNYSSNFLNPFYIIYACTNNSTLNLKIKADANKLGILVNVCDSPVNCDFTSPAIFKQQNMSVAVSSNAEDVKKSIKWRNEIKKILDSNSTNFHK